jgi:acetyltransferase-like isoleucine patch superfamily enzyme
MHPSVKRILVPIAKQVLETAFQPVGPMRPMFKGLFYAHMLGSEAYCTMWRALVATPMFLSLCERHGSKVLVDRIPFMTAPCRLEIGSNIRISGKIQMHVSFGRSPLLKIGDGVFIGHEVSFALASRIEIGNYVAIGGGTTISDTEGHDRYAEERKPAWESPAKPEDVSPVVIEDGVWIGRNASIHKGVRIGEGSIVGYGAVVRSSVPPGSMVVGNPARAIPIQLFHKTDAKPAPAPTR